MVRRPNDRRDDSPDGGARPWGARGVGHAPRVQTLTRGLKATLAVLALAAAYPLPWPTRELPALAVLRDCGIAAQTLAFSPEGRILSACGPDRPAICWEARTGRLRTITPGGTRCFYRAAFAPGGRVLAVENLDETLIVWDVARGRRVADIPAHFGSTRALAFSHDGALLASAGQSRVQIWDTAQTPPRSICLLKQRDARAIALTQDGRMLAVGTTDGSVQLWDPVAGHRVVAFRAHRGPITSLALDDGGRVLASTSSQEKVARLWDAARGRLLAELVGHTMSVQSTTFAPGGRFVATAGADETVRLWDTSTGRLLQTACGHDGPIRQVVFSPDGRLVAAAGAGSIWLWSLEPILGVEAPLIARDDVQAIGWADQLSEGSPRSGSP